MRVVIEKSAFGYYLITGFLNINGCFKLACRAACTGLRKVRRCADAGGKCHGEVAVLRTCLSAVPGLLSASQYLCAIRSLQS
ncbi:unnamed protein product [Pieris brassicae]|uniref:Uncharacterized protein n=1 Tax=Pieris brassicae TaxID=7116 RepID=A0A9P0TS71_PIEBR|nr:unnamed protein product [Pieris brassicae]